MRYLSTGFAAFLLTIAIILVTDQFKKDDQKVPSGQATAAVPREDVMPKTKVKLDQVIKLKPAKKAKHKEAAQPVIPSEKSASNEFQPKLPVKSNDQVPGVVASRWISDPKIVNFAIKSKDEDCVVDHSCQREDIDAAILAGAVYRPGEKIAGAVAEGHFLKHTPGIYIH